jgi:hypothetical protein
MDTDLKPLPVIFCLSRHRVRPGMPGRISEGKGFMFRSAASFNQDRSDVQARWQRCKRLPPLRVGEAEALTAAFLASRNVTFCPVRYAAAVEQRTQLARRERI